MNTPIPRPARLASIDAYRGLVMFLMMAEVLHLGGIAKKSGSEFWQRIAYHQTHVEWAGCSLHDLIQPSFSFLVGAALPFSLARRQGTGQGLIRATLHAAWRAFVLVFLGVFLRSIGKPSTNFTFEDTLSQIGLGYVPLFLLGLAPRAYRWIALGVILIGYWGAFALYPLPDADFRAVTGVPSEWRHMHDYTGFAAHWNKNTNLAWAFDVWFLNLFPRDKPFFFNGGGYATLSFIPTLGTMILGLIAGDWLRQDGTARAKLGRLTVAGLICLAAGWAADFTGICPSVKRIWTPAWTLYSGGWCFLLMAAFYATTDAIGLRGWAFPLRVIGMNSIAAYCMAHLINGFVLDAFRTHFGKDAFKQATVWLAWKYSTIIGGDDIGREAFTSLGPIYEPLLSGSALLLVYWLILYWMYRRGIFLRI
jgi:predicted acyltransferase